MHHHHDQKVPPGAIAGAAALMLISIGIALFGRSSTEAQTAVEDPVASVELRFLDRDDGAVAVVDAASSAEVAILEPGAGGFVRGVMRGMFRTRRLESIPPTEPFVLARGADGELVLHDPESGRSVELRSFGRDNYDAFARLLDEAS